MLFNWCNIFNNSTDCLTIPIILVKHDYAIHTFTIKCGVIFMADGNFEDSPFYVKYTGITKGTKTYGYHVKKDFENHLKQFLDARFGSDASDTEIMEQIVSDYYFRYAHERTYYRKTIIALIDKKELESANPTIIPMFVLNRFVKDYKNDVLIDEDVIVEKGGLIECVAIAEPFKNVGAELQKDIVSLIVSDGFDVTGYDVFQRMKDFNQNTLKDFFVLEIPLNNYLDAYLNGVYCFEDVNSGNAVESMHVGLGMVVDTADNVDASPIPIVYRWNLENDFSIHAENMVISKISLDTLHELCKRYHQVMFTGLKFFEMYNFNDEVKLQENRQKQAKLQDELDMLKQQEKFLADKINKKSSSD